MEKNIILSLFDESGGWSQPYRDAGYEVIQFDIQRDPSEDVYLQDWSQYAGKVYGVIAQPPCTQFAVSGARWWASKPPELLEEALGLVWQAIECIGIVNPDWYVIENPVGRLKHYIGDSVYRFHPCEFCSYADDPDDESYTKKTLLWGNFKHPIKKGHSAKNTIHGSKMHKLPPSPDRAKLRSKTPSGFARAFFDANNHKV